MTEVVFTNGRIVTKDAVIDGTLVVRDGKIAEIETGSARNGSAIDLDGDLLIPGLVELHTDTLEGHMLPRPKAPWPAISAMIAHDAGIVASGITTVFDAMAVGDINSGGVRKRNLQRMVDAISTAREQNLTKADHIVHLRCEVSDPDMKDALDPLVENEALGLFSVMDHTPGQRQFMTLEIYRDYYKDKLGFTDAEMDAFMKSRIEDQKAHSAPNRTYVVDVAHKRGVQLASHDDATDDHVAEAVRDGMTIAEFPTTVDAARASHNAGLAVMMGGPNLVRGGSHSGNVSARELAEQGLLDVISSDYAPISLLHGAMLLHEDVGYDLPRAISTVTSTPARAAGLEDRGELAPGLLADLVRIKHTPHHPLIRGVWRLGERIG